MYEIGDYCLPLDNNMAGTCSLSVWGWDRESGGEFLGYYISPRKISTIGLCTMFKDSLFWRKVVILEKTRLKYTIYLNFLKAIGTESFKFDRHPTS